MKASRETRLVIELTPDEEELLIDAIGDAEWVEELENFCEKLTVLIENAEDAEDN